MCSLASTWYRTGCCVCASAIHRNSRQLLVGVGIHHYGKPVNESGYGLANVEDNVAVEGRHGCTAVARNLNGLGITAEGHGGISVFSTCWPIQNTRDGYTSKPGKCCLWMRKEILNRSKRLLKAKRRLSERLILKTSGMPSIETLHSHLGPYEQNYEMVRYNFSRRSTLHPEPHCQIFGMKFTSQWLA